MKTLKIEIPQGYEIDKEKSTFENIVFKLAVKKLPKSWEGLKWIKGFKVGEHNMIVEKKDATYNFNASLFATKEQAEASIALAQLSQLMAVYNDGWVADFCDCSEVKHIILFNEDLPILSQTYSLRNFLAFKDKETAKEFLKNFRSLILTAKPLL